MRDSAIAKSHRDRAVSALDSDGNDNVVGVFGDRQILSVLSSEAVLDNLEGTFQKEEAAALTSSLSGIELFQPFMDDYEGGHADYRVRLFNYNDYDRNNLVKIMFEAFCNSIGVQILKKIRFTADMYIYRVQLDSLEEYQQISGFEGLYSVEKTSPMGVRLDSVPEEEMIPTKAPADGEEYPDGGCSDTGVEPIGHLSPWLLEDEHTNYPGRICGQKSWYRSCRYHRVFR